MKTKNMGNKKYKKNIKIGFTLIELLAVVIILGVLMIIAVPSVSKYINDSRNNSLISTVNEYVGGTRNIVNSGRYEMYDTNTTYYIPHSCISLENSGDSSYGEFAEAYVAVTYNGTGFDYYWAGRDKTLTSIDKLSEQNIIFPVLDIDESVSIEVKEYVIVADKNTCEIDLDSKVISTFF